MCTFLVEKGAAVNAQDKVGLSTNAVLTSVICFRGACTDRCFLFLHLRLFFVGKGLPFIKLHIKSTLKVEI